MDDNHIPEGKSYQKVEIVSDKITLWAKLFRELGFPTIVASVALYAGWKISERFIATHDLFVQSIVEAQKEQNKSMNDLVKISTRQEDNFDKLNKSQEEIISVLKEIRRSSNKGSSGSSD